MIEKLRKNLIEKRPVCQGTGRKGAMAKFNSARENFKKKEKKVKADLDEASKIWAELSKKFKWWQSLP